ncbi:MAG: single-stranded-DNA-specific exonuclease RecJ, partial [Alphaproteobacteria bacterium]|nr:single-stranded-DNA-specific exonuclease RecJ [Alphaproteobacteria bacterium]
MAFLGVNSSITGRAWIGPDPRLVRQAEALQQQTDLPAVVCQILARNDIQATETKAYLSPTMRELMPNPRGLKDMEKATKRVLEAVTGLQKIAIFADYDVDGGA